MTGWQRHKSPRVGSVGDREGVRVGVGMGVPQWAQRGGTVLGVTPAMTLGASSPDVCPRSRGDGQALWDGANPGETPISGPVTPDSNYPPPPPPRLLVSGLILFQHLDLLVRDSSHSNKAGLGCVGDIIQVRGAGGEGRGMGEHGRRGGAGGGGQEQEPGR